MIRVETPKIVEIEYLLLRLIGSAFSYSQCLHGHGQFTWLAEVHLGTFWHLFNNCWSSLLDNREKTGHCWISFAEFSDCNNSEEVGDSGSKFSCTGSGTFNFVGDSLEFVLVGIALLNNVMEDWVTSSVDWFSPAEWNGHIILHVSHNNVSWCIRYIKTDDGEVCSDFSRIVGNFDGPVSTVFL